MNFYVKQYDPIEDAIEQLRRFNETPVREREHSEEELIGLLAHQVRQDG
ncbi:MAG: hypothetical protein M3N59_00520 [bacterium]|nr:hypothetical protein [bacterium]